MGISPWFWAVWILVGFVAEMIAVFNDTTNDTLSAFLVNHIPVVWIMLGIGWLAIHFATRHKGKMRTDDP